MIPSTAAALIGFLFFVAPGLVWELLEERQRPPRGGSTFREASRIALASVVFTTLAVAILALLRWWTGAFVDPRAWIADGHLYAQREYDVIALTGAAEVFLACALAFVAAKPWEAPKTNPLPRLWHTLSQCPDGMERYVSVRLENGTIYTGAFSGLDDGPRAEGYIELQPPIQWQRAGNVGMVEDRYERVLVPLDEVRDVFVEWRNLPAAT